MAADIPEKPIKLFISYSWQPESHADWVLELATALRNQGVDVILDKWDLKEGQNAHKFMERMVADPEVGKVAIICNKTYAEKANERTGGVGTETEIITPQIYTETDQSKFVMVIAERDENGNPYIPIYGQSRVWIDMSTTELSGRNFEQLLRWIYNKPLHIKPQIGSKPTFPEDHSGPSLSTSTLAKRALDAIRQGRPNWIGTLNEYLNSYAANLKNFHLDIQHGEGPERIIENIEQFLPFRNELLEVFFCNCTVPKQCRSLESITSLF